MTRLILTRLNTVIKSIMTRSAQCNPIININAEFWKLFIGFQMVGYQSFFATAEDTSKIITLKNLASPILISPCITPILVASNCILDAILAFSSHLFTGGCFIRTVPRAKPTFITFIWIRIEKFVTLLTVLINTSFGHQYEFNKGVS